MRLRWTLLAVCSLLLALGVVDARVALQNRAPLAIPASELSRSEPPQRWLEVTGGELDVAAAISTSGSIELEALLVPLRPPQGPARVLVETRDPRLLGAFRTLHFGLDSPAAQEEWRRAHPGELRPSRSVVGMLQSGWDARVSRSSLRALEREVDLGLEGEPLVLIEGSSPEPLRAAAFLLLGLAGAVKVLLGWRRGAQR